MSLYCSTFINLWQNHSIFHFLDDLQKNMYMTVILVKRKIGLYREEQPQHAQDIINKNSTKKITRRCEETKFLLNVAITCIVIRTIQRKLEIRFL